MYLRPFESFRDDDTRVFFKLVSLAFNIKLEVFGVLDSFLSFLRTYVGKKTQHIVFDA
jgi:hypothetical protein